MTVQLTEALIYVYCKQQPDLMFSVWGIPVQASYLPFVHLILDIVSNSSIIPTLIGIVAGHCYYFLKIKCMVLRGKDYLPTPAFLYYLWIKQLLEKDGLMINKVVIMVHHRHHSHNNKDSLEDKDIALANI